MKSEPRKQVQRGTPAWLKLIQGHIMTAMRSSIADTHGAEHRRIQSDIYEVKIASERPDTLNESTILPGAQNGFDRCNAS